MTDGVRWLEQDELAAWMSLAALIFKLPGVLDYQLQRDSGLTHFEYLVLAGLSESPGRCRRMSDLAVFANGSLSPPSPTPATKPSSPPPRATSRPSASTSSTPSRPTRSPNSRPSPTRSS